MRSLALPDADSQSPGQENPDVIFLVSLTGWIWMEPNVLITTLPLNYQKQVEYIALIIVINDIWYCYIFTSKIMYCEGAGQGVALWEMLLYLKCFYPLAIPSKCTILTLSWFKLLGLMLLTDTCKIYSFALYKKRSKQLGLISILFDFSLSYYCT